jgi:hypothetical protein
MGGVGPSPKKKVRLVVFSCIYFMVCIFILWKYKYGIKVPGFPRNVANIYMSGKTKKNVFLCVAYGQYLIYSEHFS